MMNTRPESWNAKMPLERQTAHYRETVQTVARQCPVMTLPDSPGPASGLACPVDLLTEYRLPARGPRPEAPA